SDDIYDKYTYESFLSIFDYIKDKIYQYDVVPISQQVITYRNKYSKIKELEREIRVKKAIEQLSPLFQIEWLNDITKYNDFRPEKIDLAQHYCPNGERHKIGSFLYAKKNKLGGSKRRKKGG